MWAGELHGNMLSVNIFVLSFNSQNEGTQEEYYLPDIVIDVKHRCIWFFFKPPLKNFKHMGSTGKCQVI